MERGDDSGGEESKPETQPQLGDEVTLAATELPEDEDLGEADTGAADSDFDMLLRQVAAAPSWKLGGEEGELEQGQTIGSTYVVQSKIGHGGMGVVYRARDTKLDRDVAVKLHLGATGTTAVQRLVREARAMAQLSHPNIVNVFDVGEHGGQVFIAMEFVPGGSLRRYLGKGPRPWKEVLELFIQAGRGLAAAHGQGLIHRDFKPDNVLLDGQGRALVADFGLATLDARVQGSASPSPEDASATPASSSADRPGASGSPTEPSALARVSTGQGSGRSASSEEMLGGRLTATGGAVGTPAYMAPEQYAPSDLTAAADQFAFCVALYEGLYGRRPYTARSTAARMTEAAMGRIRPAPEDTEVPAWLWRVVTRGLQPEPEQRFPSMQVLVSMLERRGRRSWHVPAIVAITTLTVGTAVWMGRSEAACTGAKAMFASAYDEPQRQALDRAFARSRVEDAAANLDRVRESLATFESEWLAAFQDTCRATFIDETQSAEHHDRAMTCLRGRLDALAGLASVLASADDDVVERAPGLVDGLPPVATCGDVDALANEFPLPSDPNLRARIERIRRGMAEVSAAIDVGRIVTARSMIERVREDARGVDWEPVRIEVEATFARVLKNERRREEAAEAYERALWAAVEIGHRSFVARTSLQLGSMLALELGRPADAEPILRLAEAHVQYSTDAAYEAKLEHTRGAIGLIQRDYEVARTHFTRQLELARALGPEEREIIIALTNLAKVEDSLAEFDRAKQHYDEALERHREQASEDSTGGARIHRSRGIHFMMQRRVAEAVPEYERAVALLEAASGTRALAVVEPLVELARAYMYADRPEDARPVQQRALRILEAEGLDQDERYAGLLLGQAELDRDTDRCAEHEPSVARALEIAEQRVGSDALIERALAVRMHCWKHLGELDKARKAAKELIAAGDSARPHTLGTAYEMLADIEVSMDRAEDALASAQTGLLVLGAARLAHEPIASRLHGLRAEALSELGRKDEAIAAARQAVKPLPPGDYRTLVREFRLGQFLADEGHTDEARMWFEKNEEALKADPVEHAERLEWLSDWRKKHP